FHFLDLVSVHCTRLYLHSFPTRRSSDLVELIVNLCGTVDHNRNRSCPGVGTKIGNRLRESPTNHIRMQHSQLNISPFSSNPKSLDRKSTRLNSSHVKISYAVFCLKKKT